MAFYLQYLVTIGCMGSRTGLDILEKIMFMFAGEIRISNCEAGIINFCLMVNVWLVCLNKTVSQFQITTSSKIGPGSSVSIATELRTGRSEIESRWGRDFPPVQTGPGAHPASCKVGAGSFPGVKCGRGVMLTTHPLLVPLSRKSRAIPLPTLWATPDL